MEIMPYSLVAIPNHILEDVRKAYGHAIEVQMIPVARRSELDINEIVVAYVLGVGRESIMDWSKE